MIEDKPTRAEAALDADDERRYEWMRETRLAEARAQDSVLDANLKIWEAY